MKLHDLSLATRITIGVLTIMVAGAATLIFSESELITTIPANTLLTGFMAILLLAGIATLVLRRMFSPLRQITVAADKITAGDYDILLPQAAGGEIGSLTNALNTMLTKLSQREKLLQESATKYRRLHESMMDAFAMVDMSGRLIESNHAYREMLGYSAGELQGLTCVNLTPEKWHEFEARIIKEQVIPHGYSQVYEKEYIRKDGTIFPVEFKAFLLRDANNQPEAMWAIVRDITGRKQTEETLRNSALRHQLLFESSRDALMLVAPPSWKFTGANRATLKLFGASSVAEFTALGPWDVSPVLQPDGRPSSEKAQEMIAIAMREGTHFFEWEHQRLNGQPFSADVLLTRMDVGGELFLQATVRDISERKQVEKLLRKSTKEIEDLYNHAPCGYHSLDKDGVILMINDTELEWLGYTRDEVVGKMKWPDLLTSASLKIFREDYPRLMKQGFIHNIEIEIIRKDGTTFTGLINATAIYSSGNYVMNRATVTDITGRKRVERQLHELTAHLLSVREEEKADIAREIHDDLGGTLTALKMKTHWLKTELSANKKTTPLLDHVGEISQLIDNAMGVMRHVITGLRPTILDDLGLLAALEWQAAQFHKLTGIECRVNCICDKSEDCTTNELDKPRSIALFRISQEALTNVARHSGASLVEIEFYRNDEEIVMSVIDNGRGMAENRTEASIPYGIRGMCERVDQLGGKINFDTPPGGGFNVTVILPLPGNEEEKA